MLGIVVGLAAEARLARGLGGHAIAGGGGATGASAAAEDLVARGATALLSFGLAGGLDPSLPAGELVVPHTVANVAGGTWSVDPTLAGKLGEIAGSVLAADAILATAAEKHASWTSTGAAAADLESGAVAQVAAAANLPFAVLRAVCDPAGRDLPPAALTALDGNGRIQPSVLLRSVARHPGQIPALIALGREASRARQALLARVRTIGPMG